MKRYKTSYWTIGSILSLIVLPGTTIMFLWFPWPEQLSDRLIAFGMASFGPAILLMNAFGNKKLRNFISYACIDDQEICNKCIGFPDIVIPWTEVAEIGIGPLIHIRDGPKIAFYFSKYPIYDEKIDLSKILISDDLIWIQYSNSFCKELMRYIDITKITNYHLIEKRVEKIKRKMAK